MWCAGSPVANVDGVVIKESNEILEAFFFFCAGIPVANVDGVVIKESNDILEAIEAAYPDLNPMLPKASDPQYPRVRPLLQLERSLFSSWCVCC